jgi:hypothetical protein
MALIGEYDVVVGDTVTLAREVSERIAAGWEPYGPPVSHGKHIVQALVRRTSTGKRIRRTSED